MKNIKKSHKLLKLWLMEDMSLVSMIDKLPMLSESINQTLMR